jgi:oxygen-independent coproporphyrinogen-3 oxidase
MIAFGVSGIGEVEGGFFANQKKLSRYYAAIDAGELPIERGYELDADDRIRQYVIRQLMCNFRVLKTDVAERFGIDFDDYFAADLPELDELRDEGFVAVESDGISVAPAGRLFVRNVCMAFDRYLAAKRAGGRPVFSRTV